MKEESQETALVLIIGYSFVFEMLYSILTHHTCTVTVNNSTTNINVMSTACAAISMIHYHECYYNMSNHSLLECYLL